MKSVDDELRRVIEGRIEDERKVTKLLRDSMGKTDNEVLRLMFNKLALDSIKHENMLKAVLRMLEPSHEESEVPSEEFRRLLEKHAEIERRMLEATEEVADRVEDRRIRFLLQEIVSDERRHHAIMKRAYELLFEGGAVRDERWWDFLFRYSRLAG